MTPLVLLVSFLLSSPLEVWTPAPTLADEFCGADSVVFAVATAVDYDANSVKTQRNGAEFRITKILKGPLLIGALVYSISRARHTTGMEYVLFLSPPSPEERERFERRAATHSPTPGAVLLASPPNDPLLLIDRRVHINLDTHVLTPDLLSREEEWALRRTKTPVVILEATLEAAFAKYAASCLPSRH